MAEREPDAALQRSWLTFVIVGGGPTGVELAGQVAVLARRSHNLGRGRLQRAITAQQVFTRQALEMQAAPITTLATAAAPATAK